MFYYRLKSEYCLRGWIGVPFALVHSAEVERISKTEFDALLLCDGQTDLNGMELDEGICEVLKQFEEKGVVVRMEEPGPINPEQYYRRADNKFIREIQWSITGRCNYRCRHCYLDAPDAAMGELSTEEVFSIVDQMAECLVYRVDLTGGEPFVRKDFWQLVDYIREHGIQIGQVYTNGWLLTEEVLNRFSERGIHPEFSISFDGVGWHDWMRGVKGAEEAALKALRLCRDRGFPTNVEMCIHKGNRHVIRETVLELSEAGTGRIKFGAVSNTELWKHHAEGNAMSMEEYYDAVLDYLPHYFEDGMPLDLLFGSVVKLVQHSTEYWAVAEFDKGSEKCLNRHICGAARMSCYIAPDGRLLPCMPVAAVPDQSVFPKVQEIGLKRALKDSFYMEFVDRRVKDLLEVCRTCRECPYHLKCGGGCRANAVAEGEKDLMGPDPGKCLMWKGGYLQKVHEVCDAAIAQYCGNTDKQG